ncbi:MAG: GTP-binding protein, partial [Victivallales bacterium]|nr:GTP-binding protein [Victivallales bacterium]
MGTQFRNVGIVAHIDAGKTTLTERILFVTNVIKRMGEVQDGTTVTDWLPQERERGISINAASVTCRWKGWTINVVDTPGHIDFTEEVERSLGVMDGVIAVVCAVKGVQAQTESVWRRASRFRLPALAYINKMDREGADPERVVRQISECFSVTAVPLQYPLGLGKVFLGTVDLISRRFTGVGDLALRNIRNQVVHELRSHEIEIEIAREHLVDCLAEVDDTVLGD